MSGRVQYDPQDKIKTQMESDVVQPYKLYFGEPGIRGRTGKGVGGGHK